MGESIGVSIGVQAMHPSLKTIAALRGNGSINCALFYTKVKNSEAELLQENRKKPAVPAALLNLMTFLLVNTVDEEKSRA